MWSNNRAIIHLDMDAYFASVEQRSNPLIDGRPVIVTGSGKRTVIATASYEARKYGIKTGMTLGQARHLCPNVIRINGNPIKYLYTTHRIRDALLRFTDRVELYSIDEFFMDVTKSQPLFGSPESIAEKIKAAVRKATGLSCSCGLAPNKLLAKLGSKINKPDGLTIIHPEKIADILCDLPVGKLHGIGEKTRRYLNSLGINTAGELGDAPISILTSHFGFQGHMLKYMGEGVDNSPVHYYWEQDEVKSIGHSYTLPADTLDIELIKSYILMLCQKVTTRLHKAGKIARTVVLIVKYNDFTVFSRRKTAKHFVDTTNEIYRLCLKILREMGRLPKSVRLLGVSVTSLAEESKQLYLFEKFEKEKKLSKAVGEINNRFGDFTVKPASLLLIEKFEQTYR